MKIKINDGNEPSVFPKLMIHKRLLYVVLFTNETTGTIISQHSEFGFYSEKWDTRLYTDFTGSITLSND